jgi:hypothetical protein
MAGTEALCGGGVIILLAVSAGFVALGLLGLLLLRLGVIGSYLIKGRDDRGESQDYALNQSHAPIEEDRPDGPTASAG